jgi:hypothetical protein
MPTEEEPLDYANPTRLRAVLFEILETRMPKEVIDQYREDFDGHLNRPDEGVEAAYLCLTTKLIRLIDRVHEMALGVQPTPPGPEGFTGFELSRKFN